MLQPEPTRSGVIFLLGAGASIDAGLPATADFFRRLERSFTSGSPEQRLFNLIRKKLKSVEKDNPFISGDNFEDVIAALDDLRFRFKSGLYPFVQTWFPELAEFSGFPSKHGGLEHIPKEWSRPFTDSDRAFFSHAAISEGHTYDLLYNRVQSELRQWLEIDLNHNDVSYLARLASFEGRVQVFTLNYDVAVELACYKGGIPLTTGFSHGRWKPDEFDNHDYRLMLYKLHGSVSWLHTPPEFQIEEFPPHESSMGFRGINPSLQSYGILRGLNPPTMLFARGGKLPRFEPYVSLFARFLNAIRLAKILVIVGCRWYLEPYLKSVIEAEVNRRKSPLILIYVTKSGGDSELPKEITCGTRQALETGILQKAIEQVGHQ
ncbi:MAG TPA: hypothetical protein VGK99_03950 [Acidobacteriota bacterium]|jgi:hypothetical protein